MIYINLVQPKSGGGIEQVLQVFGFQQAHPPAAAFNDAQLAHLAHPAAH